MPGEPGRSTGGIAEGKPRFHVSYGCFEAGLSLRAHPYGSDDCDHPPQGRRTGGPGALVGIFGGENFGFDGPGTLPLPAATSPPIVEVTTSSASTGSWTFHYGAPPGPRGRAASPTSRRRIDPERVATCAPSPKSRARGPSHHRTDCRPARAMPSKRAFTLHKSHDSVDMSSRSWQPSHARRSPRCSRPSS